MTAADSKLDIERLREEGIVFVSQATSRTIARGITMALLAILIKGVPWKISFPSALTSEVILSMIIPWFLFIAASTAVIIALSFTLTVLQTKFYTRFEIVDDAQSSKSLMYFGVIDFISALILLGIIWNISEGFQLTGVTLESLQKLLPRLLFIASGISIVKGVLCFFIDRRLFRLEYASGRPKH
jgi:hypothetical protein